MSRYVASTNVGDTIPDILNKAAHVFIEGRWYPVLGYDQTDDVLCAEGFGKPDWTINCASLVFKHTDVRVPVDVEDTMVS